MDKWRVGGRIEEGSKGRRKEDGGGKEGGREAQTERLDGLLIQQS